MRMLSWVLAIATLAACASRPLHRVRPETQQIVRQGVWGNASEMLFVDVKGGRFEGICVSGTIEMPLVLDEGGEFTASGSWKLEGGRRAEGTETAKPVRFVGYVMGGELSLTVLSGSTELLATTLHYGVNPEARNCP